MTTQNALTGLPLSRVADAYLSIGGVQGVAKSQMIRALAQAIDHGHITLADVRAGTVRLGPISSTPTAPAPAPTQSQHVQTLAQNLTALKTALESDIEGLRLKLDSVAQAQSGICSTAVAQAQRQAQALAEGVAAAASAESKSLRTQVQTLAQEVGAVRIDPAQVDAAVTQAVAAAFRPFAQAVTQAGAEEAVGAMVAAQVVRRVTAEEAFGVEVLGHDGDHLMVDIYDDPTAEQHDPCFIWSEQIIRALICAADTGANLWCGGEKGTGKSETIRQFAARCGRSYCRINFRKFTTSDDYIGAVGLSGGSTGFVPGPFLSAFTRPGAVVLLDEVTNTDPGELAPLNGLLEPHAAVTIGGSVWRRGSGVFIAAADNTLTNGDQSGRYAGTRTMNSSLADRFALIVPFQYLPLDQEIEAVQRHTGCAEPLARHVLGAVHVARSKVSEGEIIDAPSIRSVVAFIRALRYFTPRTAWEMAIAARQPVESAIGLEGVYTACIDEALIARNI